MSNRRNQKYSGPEFAAIRKRETKRLKAYICGQVNDGYLREARENLKTLIRLETLNQQEYEAETPEHPFPPRIMAMFERLADSFAAREQAKIRPEDKPN